MKLIRPELARSGSLDNWLQDFFLNDDVFTHTTVPWSFRSNGRNGFTTGFRADFFEDADAYHSVMELPGVKKEDLEVEVENSVLTVSGKRSSLWENEDYQEEFSRSVNIPDAVDSSRIEAELKDGLLLVTMPKDESNKVRTITVN